MTDSTDGAWKLPAKTSTLCCNKEPESQREKYGWKRQRARGMGDKERLRERQRRRENDRGKREEKVVLV